MLDALTLTIIGAFLSAGVGGLGYWLKKKSNKKRDYMDDIADLKKAVWRLNKTILIMAKLLDSKTRKAHPEIDSELEEIARELLSNSDALLDENS